MRCGWAGKYLLTRTRVIQWLAALWLLGILFSRYGWRISSQLLFIATALVLVLAVFKRWQLVGVTLLVISFSGGIIRGTQVFNSFRPLQQRYNQNVNLVGQIQDDPAASDRAQTEFHLNKLHLITDQEQAVGGRINIRGFANNKLQRGDIVAVSGKLRPALGNQQGQISYAQIEILAHDNRWLSRLRQRFLAGTYSALPEPHASLGLGFLIGTRSLLPENLLNQLSSTGLTHIVAVSGYNLTILVRLMRRLLASHSKFLATSGAIGLIVAFVAVTGMSPSIMRAAIVSGLAILSWYYGRTIKPLLLILAAAAITAGINPAYLWYDVGWYLSFLAFFGIMMVSPAILSRVYGTRTVPALVQLLSETTVAQLMTMPLIMFIFKQASVVAIPANLIVLPLIPIAMLSSLVAGLAGMFFTSVAGWFSWPAKFILGMIVQVVERFGNLAHAQISLRISGFGLVTVYAVIIFVTIVLRAKMSAKSKKAYSLVR